MGEEHKSAEELRTLQKEIKLQLQPWYCQTERAGEVSVQPHLEVEQALVPFDLILREPCKEYSGCKQCSVVLVGNKL